MLASGKILYDLADANGKHIFPVSCQYNNSGVINSNIPNPKYSADPTAVLSSGAYTNIVIYTTWYEK